MADDLDRAYELWAALISPDHSRVLKTLAERGYTAEQQLHAMRLIVGVKVGSAWNGYSMARLAGLSADEARAQPATGMLLKIADYLGPEAPEALRIEPQGFDGPDGFVL